MVSLAQSTWIKQVNVKIAIFQDPDCILKSIFFAPLFSLIIAEKCQIILIMFKNVLDPKAEFL